jgi:predicted RNA-binding Zn ribbon-like protein
MPSLGEVQQVVTSGRPLLAFDLSGGALCLDFANTVDDRPSDRALDQIGTYGDLLAFTRQAGALSPSHLALLPPAARRRPDDAAAALGQAIVVREALFRLFLAVANGEPPPASDLAILNQSLADALGHLRVEPHDEGYTWAWDADDDALDAPLWPVVRSAGGLLASPLRESLRVCASQSCGWLFLDTSRNGTRRWCSMRTCGNRAKARRHHARVRASQAADQ